MLLKIFTHPQPVMAVSTGHTIAAGGFMLLAGDTRLGADGDFKIGMTLLEFGLMFARERVSNRHFTNAAIQTHLVHAPRGRGYRLSGLRLPTG